MGDNKLKNMSTELEKDITEIKVKISAVETKLDNILVLFDKHDALEERVRELENFKWKVIGLSTASCFIISVVVAVIVKII